MTEQQDSKQLFLKRNLIVDRGNAPIQETTPRFIWSKTHIMDYTLEPQAAVRRTNPDTDSSCCVIQCGDSCSNNKSDVAKNFSNWETGRPDIFIRNLINLHLDIPRCLRLFF